MEKIKISIDGLDIYANKGETILKAAEANDIFIPHLCGHADLHPVGGCQLCVVEIEGEKEIQTSCTTKIEYEIRVKTKSEKLDEMRRISMELMLANHVDDCTTCPKYLKCELQSLIQYLGISTSRVRRTLDAVPVDKSNPLFVRDLNRCVQCGRCIRVCKDVRGIGVWESTKTSEGRSVIAVKDNKSMIDANCRFCGACVEVCPTGALQDKDGTFKDGHRNDVLVPCKTECPAGINIPKYVRDIKNGNYDEAAAVIREKAPFPKSLGLICMRFCENKCRRNDLNDTVSIRDLKRFASENDSYKWKEKTFQKEKTGKTVAIIGSGPAGLTAAYYLAKLGHEVDVYEKLPIAGGMLTAGIPEYRLPNEIVQSEIEIIKEAGVNIITNCKVKLIKVLQEENYDSILMAIGTDKGMKIPIPGSELPDVHVNMDFLRKDLVENEIELKDSVIVLGGGNVAFDCARTAKRLGCSDVSIVCLESRESMPASIEEIEEGLEEGIKIYNNRTFIKIEDENGKPKGVSCEEVNSFEFDKNGKLILNKKENSEHLISGEMVIFAIGQKADWEKFGELEINEKGLINVNRDGETNIKGVFAVGDAVIGTSSVIQAIAEARKIVTVMDRYLGGDGDITENLSSDQQLDSYLGVEEDFATIKQNKFSCIAVENRINNFDLMTVGFDENEAKCEASRCLQCDLRPELTKQKFWTEYRIK